MSTTIKIPAANALRPRDLEAIEERLKRETSTSVDSWLLFHWCIILTNVITVLCNELVRARLYTEGGMGDHLRSQIMEQRQTYNQELFKSAVAPPSKVGN